MTCTMEQDMELSPDDLHKVFKELIKAKNQWYDLGLALGIPSTTLDSIKGQYDRPKDRLREMFKEWLNTVDPKPSWRAAVEALRDETVEEYSVAEDVKRKYWSDIERSETVSTISNATQQTQVPTSTSEPTADLEHVYQTVATLKHLQKVESNFKAVIVKDVVNSLVVTSIQSGMSTEQVHDQLQKLYREEKLISEDDLRTAQQLVREEHAKPASSVKAKENGAAESAPPAEPTTPLFCKDTIYHAGICSYVVSKCDAGDYQKFFKNKELVPGHSFKAVSMSRLKQDTFLIAQKDEATYYFAFKSEPHLLQWSKQFKSFSEGIMTQSEQFPIRFIIELLNQQCRIVLSGFSFGGLLACAVAARVWDSPYISSSLLKDNMTCITFGQPHVAVQVIEKVTRIRPEMVSTLHAVYLEEDLIPSLMSLLDESWSAVESLSAESENTTSVHASLPPELKAPFLDPTTSVLLESLGSIQTSQNSCAALDELKSKFREVVPKITDRRHPPCRTSYLIACEESAGLVWSKVTGDKSTALTLPQAEQLDEAVYEKHAIKEYSDSLFVGLLDKPPKYDLPPAPKHAPNDVDGLKPSIDEVHIQHHGDQTAFVLEGRNLWFCREVSVCGHKAKTPAQEISGSSIQFNVPREKEDKDKPKERKERVALHTHFSSKPVKLNEISVFEKGYSIKTRQKQLARCTPSEVIELAYLSALLEQHPNSLSEPFSHKLQVITKFLEDVVKVVPFESISYAIANCSYDNAVRCYEVMLSCGIEIPKSELMQFGISAASRRMMLGYPGSILASISYEGRQRSVVPYSQEVFKDVTVDEKRGVISCTSTPYMHGLRMAIGAPVDLTIDIGPATRSQTNLVILHKLQAINIQLKTLTVVQTVSGLNIELVYPVKSETSPNEIPQLSSPLRILTNGRKRLAELATKAQQELTPAAPSSTRVKRTRKSNQQMLETVNDIRTKEIDLCTSLLGGFMNQQEIGIALNRPQRDPSEEVHVYSSASIGVWALFSLDYSRVQPLLAKCRGDQLLVQILDYVQSISGVLPTTENEDSGPYAAKLQFMVQGITKTVTCNTQHVSYSLEHQLVELCKEKNIDAATPLGSLTRRWSELFKQTTLSLVAERHRPLIARWLKWALMVHNLREELAKYTAVGVAGLVNSGKSKLVNTLFGIKIPTGTTEAKRTTVPFLYNLDESVEGLNVVDFPGVDDEDDTIGDLADLLLTIAQIVLFVVDYRKVHTQSTRKWLERLQKENVPVLVCLTFGDKLYAEHMTKKREHPDREHMKMLVREQLSVIEGKLCKPSDSHKVQFFSFSQDNDSVLNSDEGREKLKGVGIGSPLEVGEWLVRVFRKDFGQDELADRLESFVHGNIQKVL